MTAPLAAGARPDARAGRPGKDGSVAERIRDLGPWFHNLRLGGVQTAPEHFLGDFPRSKWQRFQHALDADWTGRSVLDIGCNGGFHCLELKRRGAARVLGIDCDERYLAQARFAAEFEGLDIEFQKLSVYDVGLLRERFDLVLFMGVLYHLRHPLLALDLLREHVVADLLVFQSLLRGSPRIDPVEQDYSFEEVAPFDEPGYPKMHFVERSYAGDPTNWWIPNKACAEAMLRSAGFSILNTPEHDVYLCRAAQHVRRDPEVT